MKNLIVFQAFFVLETPVTNTIEIGPEGFKLILILLAVLGIASFFFFRGMIRRKKKYTRFRKIRKKTRVEMEFTKNRLYFPDFLTLVIRNTGTADVDIERPLMIFKSLLMKRKFRLKGLAGYHFYPLYLSAGNEHTLQIDLNRFYQHDKHLKRYPEISVEIYSVKGKKLGRKSVMLRKTLFR